MDYSASYTGGGLLFEITEALFPLIIDKDADNLLFQEARANQYMKINSERSRIRMIQEIKKRKKFSDDTFWNFYKLRDDKEKKLLLFFICLKTYNLMYDFHFNVTVPKVLSLDMEIDAYKYRMRLDEIASVNGKVANWSETTLKKVITSYTFMVQSAGLSHGNILIRPEVNHGFFCYFVKTGELWPLDAFFLKTHEREKLIKDCNDN